MRKRLSERELDLLRMNELLREEIGDETVEGFVVRPDEPADPQKFRRTILHDGIPAGYGEGLDRHGKTWMTTYAFGIWGGEHVGSRLITKSDVWELVAIFGGASEVECPLRTYDPDTEESKGCNDEPFKVKRRDAQLTSKPERPYPGPRWHGDKRPNARRGECIYCEERIGEEHGYLSDDVTIEIWQRIAELPTREELVEGLARTFFVEAYIDHVENDGEPFDGEGHPCEGCTLFADWEEDGHEEAHGGQDWFDVLADLDTPQGALDFAEQAARKIEAEGVGLLPGLYLYTCALPGKHRKEPDADRFAHYLAMQFMGHGVGWSDDHPDFDFDFPFGESWAP